MCAGREVGFQPAGRATVERDCWRYPLCFQVFRCCLGCSGQPSDGVQNSQQDEGYFGKELHLNPFTLSDFSCLRTWTRNLEWGGEILSIEGNGVQVCATTDNLREQTKLPEVVQSSIGGGLAAVVSRRGTAPAGGIGVGSPSK